MSLLSTPSGKSSQWLQRVKSQKEKWLRGSSNGQGTSNRDLVPFICKAVVIQPKTMEGVPVFPARGFYRKPSTYENLSIDLGSETSFQGLQRSHQAAENDGELSAISLSAQEWGTYFRAMLQSVGHDFYQDEPIYSVRVHARKKVKDGSALHDPAEACTATSAKLVKFEAAMRFLEKHCSTGYGVATPATVQLTAEGVKLPRSKSEKDPSVPREDFSVTVQVRPFDPSVQKELDGCWNGVLSWDEINTETGREERAAQTAFSPVQIEIEHADEDRAEGQAAASAWASELSSRSGRAQSSHPQGGQEDHQPDEPPQPTVQCSSPAYSVVSEEDGWARYWKDE